MVEITLVVVKRFAMIRVEYDDRLVQDSALLQGCKNILHAGIQVSDGAIVLGDDIVLIRDSRRHPAREEIAEGLEVHHRLHGPILGMTLVAMIKHALEGFRRQVGRMWVHVAQKQEEGFSLARQAV